MIYNIVFWRYNMVNNTMKKKLICNPNQLIVNGILLKKTHRYMHWVIICLVETKVICRGSVRHLYVVCIYGAICLQKKFLQILLFFHQKVKYKFYFMLCPNLCKKIPRFNGKTGRYYDMKIKFVDISHNRYKLHT
jgi:hypothetical protein